jgi:hypothetical protein
MRAVLNNKINMLPLLRERGADANIVDQVRVIKEGEGGSREGRGGG